MKISQINTNLITVVIKLQIHYIISVKLRTIFQDGELIK